MAAFNDGGFVVVWDSRDDENGTTAILAQRFDGSALGLSFDDRVECNGGVVGHPLVATDSYGGFTVVWERFDPDLGTTDLRGQTFSHFGDPQGSEVRTASGVAQAGLDSLAMPDGLNPLVYWRDLSAAAPEATGESAPLQPAAGLDFVPGDGVTCR